MLRLLELVDEAREIAQGEVARQLQICNACRYCEGFCAVFPAMTRRLEFSAADSHYLANLCHSCGACLHACQYAPPHEFAVNVPQAMARLRSRTYEAYAWPAPLGALYRHHGLALSLALAFGIGLFLALLLARQGGSGSLLHEPLAGNFYALFPHGTMVAMFGTVSLFVLLAMLISLARFWREVGSPNPADAAALGELPQVRGQAVREAAGDALGMRYLGDCNNEDDAVTPWRRRMHHLTFYGFGLCFASTSVATAYHYVLGLKAPYPVDSLPVLLGILGGIGLVIGTTGLWMLRTGRHPQHKVPEQSSMDHGFIALLWLLGTTGLALLFWRDTRWMGLLLAVHLGVVMAFFITAPYGKFMHGFYRLAALLKYAIEKRLPSTLRLGD